MLERTPEVKVLRDPIHGYIHIDLKVVWDCPYGIIRTNGKTQYFQGFQRLSLPIQFLFQP